MELHDFKLMQISTLAVAGKHNQVLFTIFYIDLADSVLELLACIICCYLHYLTATKCYTKFNTV